MAAVAVAVGAVLAPRLWGSLQVVEVAVAPAIKVSATTGQTLGDSTELTAAGYVVADRQSVLATEITGRLVKLHVSEADFVTQGTVVAEVDHSELDASIVQAQAEVAVAAAEAQRLARLVGQAEAEIAAGQAALETFDAENRQNEILLADAQRRLELGERLAPAKAVPAAEVDDRRTELWGVEAKITWTRRRKTEAERKLASAEAQAAAARAAVVVAEARHQSAAAQVKVLERQRDEAFVRAPFDGMVTEKAAEVGEIVAPISIGGSMARGSIVTLVDWASLQAEVDVAESQLARVKPGQRAAITVDAIPGRVFPGKLRRVLPRADRSKATVKVRVDFIDRDPRAILPEMGVRVRFLADNAPEGLERGDVPEKLVVPAAAVHSTAEASWVWVVLDAQAHRRAVQVGEKSDQRVEIAGGLQAGEKVVVRGAERLSGEVAPVRLAE